jgi:hypothetical protein
MSKVDQTLKRIFENLKKYFFPDVVLLQFYCRHDTQHKDIQLNITQNKDIKHNNNK